MTRRSAFVGAVTPSQDDQSFRLAFNQNYRDILANALRRSSTADADDIAAETFTIAWRTVSRQAAARTLPLHDSRR
ncbi:MAG: hypothetical protein ACXWH0_03125 [Acidimicrobiia bacterium]